MATKIKVSEWLINDWFSHLNIADKCMVLNIPFAKDKAYKDRDYFLDMLRKTDEGWEYLLLKEKTDIYNDYFDN